LPQAIPGLLFHSKSAYVPRDGDKRQHKKKNKKHFDDDLDMDDELMNNQQMPNAGNIRIGDLGNDSPDVTPQKGFV